jgi:shikimate dehydrogenase
VNRLFGLIGYPLGHSWSKKYFDNKFLVDRIKDAEYMLFPLQGLKSLVELIGSHSNLCGFNVTIPYKTSIIPYLNYIDPSATEIRAVNTIKVDRTGSDAKLHGYNTDAYGFEQSIRPLLKPHHRAALILGSGGAAKAAAWVFKLLDIEYIIISRNPSEDLHVSYTDLTQDLFEKFTIIVNATPLGMEPARDTFPPLPYQFISKHHLMFDMVYNPLQTVFLQQGQKQGATVKNGLEMLHLQADEAWKIWNRDSC